MKKPVFILAGAVLSISLLVGCNAQAGANILPNKGQQVATQETTQPATDKPMQAVFSSNKEEGKQGSKPDTQEALAKRILRSAKQGTLPYLPKDLGIGTSNELIFQLWGRPKDGSSGPVLMYEKYHTDISLDSFDKVVEITSYRPDYKKLKVDQVMKEIGKPTKIEDTSKDAPNTAEAIYNIKDQFGDEIHLIFSHNTKTKQVIYVRLYVESKADKIKK
ncbi:hypothetical protein J2Z48_000046 [Croceifilum oryzae]|uniref:Lipoprotein n=1 Tax=Croceifilum oryzae TaxID=1553429 RepID=A0AAJ1WRD4_9BACL|nr:DUF4309 domain-containing protein [Croceifilum oryzae]MDQ0415888.1 hypothetical protein [Croceifilum oryzae]